MRRIILRKCFYKKIFRERVKEKIFQERFKEKWSRKFKEKES